MSVFVRSAVGLAMNVLVWLFFGLLWVGLIKPRVIPWFLNDPNISYPYTEHEMVDVNLLMALSVGVPVAVMLIVDAFAGRLNVGPGGRWTGLPTIRRIIAFGFGFAVLSNFVNITKAIVGRHRPDFIARCQPNTALAPIVPDTGAYAAVTDDICTGDGYKLLDGHQSFPSGHSADSTYGAVVAVLYACKFLPRETPSSVVTIISLVLLLIVSLCAGSRFSDHRHNLSDIAAGIFIGLVIAVYVHAAYLGGLWVVPQRRASRVEVAAKRSDEVEARGKDDEEELNNDIGKAIFSLFALDICEEGSSAVFAPESEVASAARTVQDVTSQPGSHTGSLLPQ